MSRLDLRMPRFAHYFRDPKNPASMPYNSGQAFLTDRHGKTWIGTNQGLLQFDPATERFTPYPLLTATTPPAPHNNIRALVEDQGAIFGWEPVKESIA